MKFKFGRAFVDNVTIFRSPSRKPMHLRGWGIRLTFFYVFLIGSLFLLGVRLFHLTLVRGEENRSLSENNRVREITIHAPRGTLVDRRGQVLTRNLASWRIVGPCTGDCRPKLINESDLVADPLLLHSVFWERDYIRDYLYPYELAHVVGYLGEITAEEIASPAFLYQGYLSGDKIGRSGVEAAFESKLRGVNGKELIEVNAQNQKKRSLGQIDAVPGADIQLSLDIDLQKKANEALGETPGAIVVTKPKTGEILALVSNPGFDANEINLGVTGEKYKLLTGDDHPLFNRALSGIYPPGSTFKLVTAVAALESGKIKQDTLIEDVGILTVGKFSFANWYFTQYGGKDGQVDLVKGLARSNDIYFYKLGEVVGVDEISRWGRIFGVGEKTGIELLGEAEGIMPDPVWRKKVKGQDWFLGDTYHLAIGQGELGVTPLQVNLWTNTIAGGGIRCKPTVLKVRNSPQNTQNCKELGIKKQTIKAITLGMQRACSPDGGWGYQGTGWPLFEFTVFKENLTESGGSGEKRRIPIACKTGTSEFGDPLGRTHAWFTAFAPLPAEALAETGLSTITGDPEIVVTVLVEKGGEGSSVAAPIAKKILEEWFRR